MKPYTPSLALRQAAERAAKVSRSKIITMCGNDRPYGPLPEYPKPKTDKVTKP